VAHAVAEQGEPALDEKTPMSGTTRRRGPGDQARCMKS
jgi:hypothetical protein